MGDIEGGREKHEVLYGMLSQLLLDLLVFCSEVANINRLIREQRYHGVVDPNTSLLACSTENGVPIPIVEQVYHHHAGEDYLLGVVSQGLNAPS